MRIDNGTDSANIAGARTSAARDVGSEPRIDSQTITPASAEDEVTLSNANSLVTLARNVMPPDRQAHVDAVAAQYRSGNYHPSDSEIGKAILQSHLED
jgi:hypothetical protein